MEVLDSMSADLLWSGSAATPDHCVPEIVPGAAVLILEAEPAMRSFMQRGLARHCPLVEVAGTTAEAGHLLRRCHFDLLVADVGVDGEVLSWLDALPDWAGRLGLVVVSGDSDAELAIRALRAGASDFLLKPFRLEQLLAAVSRTAERHDQRGESYLLHREMDRRAPEGLVGDCAAMREVYAIIERIAPMPSTVLVEGESGTGKELAARTIHDRSGRDGRFVAINCAGVSPELLESELYGHVKGAFTGAQQAREGLFGFAHGGTLFLDEIGEMPHAMQTTLLRVLEERSVRPVGGNELVPVDVRIVAATNCRLQEEVAAGRFRKDLFYRINVVALRLPPLRERRADIVSLTRFFVGQLSAEMGIPPPRWDDGDYDPLSRYDWPGNVRELRNLIERCLLLGQRPAHFLPQSEVMPSAGPTGDDLTLAAVERAHILRVLSLAEDNKSEAARRLGISRKTLERKLKAWGKDGAVGE